MTRVTTACAAKSVPLYTCVCGCALLTLVLPCRIGSDSCKRTKHCTLGASPRTQTEQRTRTLLADSQDNEGWPAVPLGRLSKEALVSLPFPETFWAGGGGTCMARRQSLKICQPTSQVCTTCDGLCARHEALVLPLSVPRASDCHHGRCPTTTRRWRYLLPQVGLVPR